MKPIKFNGHNIVLAENQPEYIPLPACNECTPEGSFVYCYQLSFWERLKVLFSGRILCDSSLLATNSSPFAH